MRHATIALSAVLFSLPSVFFAAGVRAGDDLNRAPTPWSEVHPGWRMFGQFGDFLSDRIPLRSQAVDIDSWIDRKLFGEDPSFGGSAMPKVVEGRDGNLFLHEDIEMACRHAAFASEAIANLSSIIDLIAASGRNAYVSVAPNKSTIDAPLLDDDTPGRGCLDSYTSGIRSAIAATIPDGAYVDLYAALAGEDSQPRYYRTDSHWSPHGSLLAIRSFVDTVAPEIWDASAVVDAGPIEYAGDLTLLQGDVRNDTAEWFDIRREGVSEPAVDVRDGGDLTHIDRTYTTTGPRGSMADTRLLVVTDSFGVKAFQYLTPWFSSVTFFHFDNANPDLLAQRIADADVVWFLSVERSIVPRFETHPARPDYFLGDPGFLQTLSDALGFGGE